VDIVLLILWIPILVSMLSKALGPGEDTPTWELRWRSLTPEDRNRIATAIRADAELDPEDAELAAGFNRRRGRRSSYVEAPLSFLFVTATALSALGLMHGFTGWALPLAAIGTSLWLWFGEKRLNAASRIVTVPDARI
jgi:hypothetical protein